MALVHSGLLPLGTKMPHVELVSVENDTVSPDDFKQSMGILVAFICNHCPYVQAIEDRLIALAHHYHPKQCAFIAICSNDSKNYPEDSKEQLKKRALEKGYGFPYLLDEEQTVAKAFGAVCTPDLFLFDQNRTLFYHGQLDDNWRDVKQVTSHDLKEAIEAMRNGLPAPLEQKPSMGCSIKWKP